jgi:molecular chaperone GrpE
MVRNLLSCLKLKSWGFYQSFLQLYLSTFHFHWKYISRASIEIEKDKDNEILKGIVLIKNKLYDSLKSKGLSLIEINKGDEFNADHHEAVTQIDSPDKNMKGKIIDIIEKGYKLGEKVIRYPKVVIGK